MQGLLSFHSSEMEIHLDRCKKELENSGRSSPFFPSDTNDRTTWYYLSMKVNPEHGLRITYRNRLKKYLLERRLEQRPLCSMRKIKKVKWEIEKLGQVVGRVSEEFDEEEVDEDVEDKDEVELRDEDEREVEGHDQSPINVDGVDRETTEQKVEREIL